MEVKLEDGSMKQVGDLSIGELIESPNGLTPVTYMLTDHPREGYYIIEKELYITNDHPILVDGDMIPAEDYNGEKEYISESTNTIYVETENELFNVYCSNNIYTVSGKYGPRKD